MELEHTGIKRERTALSRNSLSSPIEYLMRFGFLDGQHTVFDYGCGRGDDVRLLGEMKIRAAGWDPVYRPDEDRRPADIVNLGFVLNVIEDAEERADTLKTAFALARKVLIVSVMLGYQKKRAEYSAYEDGVRTQRNTFQKYYSQDEFRTYVETMLGINAIPVAAGIFIVFRDPVDEQLFLLARQQVRRRWSLIRREPGSEAIALLIEQHREQINTYWLMALELGRAPAIEEYPDAHALISIVGSWRRVHDWVARFFSSEELDASSIGRQEDLLVYFALEHFRRRRPYAHLPDRLRRDVRCFFGNITRARTAGKRALFAAGDTARVEEAALFCHDELGIGKLDERHHLTFHQSVLGESLPLIRIVVGCALQLFSDVGAVDLIQIHLQSGKVTFLVYDDFEGSRIPRLVERVKVDLPRLRVDFYDYLGDFEPEHLEGDPKDFYQR